MTNLKETIKQVISRYGYLTDGMADELVDEINRNFIVIDKEEYASEQQNNAKSSGYSSEDQL